MTIHDMEIREAVIADLAPVTRLPGVQLQEHAMPVPVERLGHAVQQLIEDPALGRILVALEGDEIVGVAALSFLLTLEHGGAAAWLDELYVDPRRRRGGIGRRLTEAAIAVARSRGCLALDLEVEPGHEHAERLCERMGFRRHRRVRWMYPL